MTSKTILIALGGNAIKQYDEKGTVEEQFRNVKIAAASIVQLVKKGYNVIITHGNGPQVGNLLLQQESGESLVPSQPMNICGAMTQGQIGYMLQLSINNLLKEHKMEKAVAAVISMVLVDKNDPSFRQPTKPVGPFYSEEEVSLLKSKHADWKFNKISSRGWRRVVASPKPIRIIEEVLIKKISQENIVIAAGGGGIPVYKDESGMLQRIDAVVDKDLASEKLAEVIQPDIFAILTDVDGVYLNFDKDDKQIIQSLAPDEARKYLTQGCFGEGSMKPKVEACVKFIESGGRESIITSLDKIVEAVGDRSVGTHFGPR
jgi:carbamate kinase